MEFVPAVFTTTRNDNLTPMKCLTFVFLCTSVTTKRHVNYRKLTLIKMADLCVSHTNQIVFPSHFFKVKTLSQTFEEYLLALVCSFAACSFHAYYDWFWGNFLPTL